MSNENTVTHTIDAAGKALGRLATEAAHRLQNKHRPDYAPNRDGSERVRVINASKIKWTGKKLEQKEYQWTSMYLGGLKSRRVRDVFAKDPAAVVAHAVYTMLPHNKLRPLRMKRLHVEP